MTDKVHCADAEALIAYVYGESDGAERARVEAHAAACPRCAAELGALSGARQLLASWVPPEARVDFRLTRRDADRPALVAPAATTPVHAPPKQERRWWAQPLPAWAQLAAALVIFAAGVAAGGARFTRTADNQAQVQDARVEQVPAPQPVPVAGPDLAAIESRLMMLEDKVAAPNPPVRLDATARAALVRQITRELEQQQPWNSGLYEVVVTMRDEFQKDMALLRREAGLDPRASRLATTATTLR